MDVEALIDEYADMVYKIAFAHTRNRNDADDIFQDVFLRVIRKQPSFESKEHEKAWVIRVTINCCKTLWLTASKFQTKPLDQCPDLAVEETEEGLLEVYLCKLPQKYRIPIHLFYYEDMSTLQISQALGRKESTVRMQLTRARRLLKEFMEGELSC